MYKNKEDQNITKNGFDFELLVGLALIPKVIDMILSFRSRVQNRKGKTVQSEIDRVLKLTRGGGLKIGKRLSTKKNKLKSNLSAIIYFSISNAGYVIIFVLEVWLPFVKSKESFGGQSQASTEVYISQTNFDQASNHEPLIKENDCSKIETEETIITSWSRTGIKSKSPKKQVKTWDDILHENDTAISEQSDNDQQKTVSLINDNNRIKIRINE